MAPIEDDDVDGVPRRWGPLLDGVPSPGGAAPRPEALAPVGTGGAVVGALSTEHALEVGNSLKKIRSNLRSDVAWDGNFWRDYAFFVQNRHPLLGICLAHPLHPWSKRERLTMFFVVSTLTLFPTAMLHYNDDYYDDIVGAKAFLSLRLMLLVTLPVMIVEKSLHFVAERDDLLKDSRSVMGRAMYRCAVAVKRACFGAAVVCAALTFCACGVPIITWYAKERSVEDLFAPYIASRLQSWLVWFPMKMLMPCSGFLWKWRREMRGMKEAGNAPPGVPEW